MSLDTIRKAVIVVVTILWTASLVVTALDRTYDPPGTLHVLMVAVVTFLLGAPSILKDGKEMFDSARKPPKEPPEQEGEQKEKQA